MLSIHVLSQETERRPDHLHEVVEMTRADVMRSLLKQHTRARRIARLRAQQDTPLSWLRGVWQGRVR
jgi:predicted transcriptional regulator